MTVCPRRMEAVKDMDRTKTQFSRLMDLDRRIRNNEYPNCLTFSHEWEVSQKTVQRDIDFLRDQCGAPLEYDRERKGFRYADATWMLPSVLLSEGELLAVLLAARVAEQYRGSPLAEQIDRLFNKLSGLLPDKISVNPALLYSRFTFTGPPAKPVDAGVWTTVVRGLLTQHALRVAYRPCGAEKTDCGKESTIHPYHIANLQGEWYVFAVHAGHSDVRQFAMARIKKARLTDQRFEMPAGFDPQKRLAGTFARFAGDGKPQVVRLLFDKEAAAWVTERQWHPAQKLRHRKTGQVELEFPATGLFEVQRWVLSWGRWVKVLAPNELKKAVTEEIRQMARR